MSILYWRFDIDSNWNNNLANKSFIRFLLGDNDNMYSTSILYWPPGVYSPYMYSGISNKGHFGSMVFVLYSEVIQVEITIVISMPVSFV